MKFENNPVSVSSDMRGFFAKPHKVKNIYERAGYQKVGIEMVLMPAQLYYLNQIVRGRKDGSVLNGVHGQLVGMGGNPLEHKKGIYDWLLINVADGLIPKTYKRLTRPFPFASRNGVMPVGMMVDMIGAKYNKDLYFNVHNGVVEKEYDLYLEYANQFNNFSHLTIENGPNPGDLVKTIALVKKMRADGAVKVTGTLDLAHLIVERENGSVPDKNATLRNFMQILTVLENNHDIFRHIHLPIGLNEHDSIPMIFSDSFALFWERLGAIIQKYNIHVTFENQHSLIFGVKDEYKEIERLRIIRLNLHKRGVI